MATGQVLFQRFFYSKSFVKQSMETVAMACVYLASKIEESPRRIRDVCNVFNHIKQVRTGKMITPLILDQDYINLKNQVIKAERRILKELGFCVHVKHPHKTIVTMLQLLDASDNRTLMQRSWNYMNDSLRTEVFVRFPPETIACACIYLSARELEVPLPSRPAWYLLFDASENEIQDIARIVMRLYKRPKPDAEKLEKTIADFKTIQLETRLKVKNASGSNTPVTAPGFSPGSRTGSPKNVNAEKKGSKCEGDNQNGGTPNDKAVSNHVSSKPEKRKSSSRENSRERKDNSRSLTPIKHGKKHERSPPRSYKERRHHRHHKSRSRSREKKDSRHKIEKKRRRSRSRSPSPYIKKSKDYRNSQKARSDSRSPVRLEKVHRTSRKERSRDRRRSRSHEKSRR